VPRSQCRRAERRLADNHGEGDEPARAAERSQGLAEVVLGHRWIGELGPLDAGLEDAI
jgi:hypothetical protein